MRDEAVTELRSLNEVVERLRAPGGCPWDREQTHRSLRPYLLEETYEVLEAIESGDPAQLREELGDVLLQVLMHCAIAQEAAEGFDIGDVAERTRAKMVHRHPHVFADAPVSGAAEVVVNWERLKAAEKRGRLSVLDGVPRTLPALSYALGVQKRPARLGFDQTPAVGDALAATSAALDAVAEQVGQTQLVPPRQGADWTVDMAGTAVGAADGDPGATTSDAASPARAGGHAAGSPPAPPQLEAAVGDLLFAAVALARRLRVNPEEALRQRAHRFGDHFRALEGEARAEGLDLHGLDAAAWQERWRRAGA